MSRLAWLRANLHLDVGEGCEQARTAERHYRVRLSMLTNLASKGTGLLVLILSVSQTVGYLGAERFGAWMTLASLSALLAFLDMGIANALINRVAAASARTRVELSAVISGGLGLLALIGLAISLALSGVTLLLPWDLLIKVTDPAITSEVRQAAALMAVLFGVSLFSTGVQRVFFGLQAAHLAHFLSTLTNILVLALLWYATHQQAGIVELLFVTLGTQVLLPLLLLIWLVGERLLLPLGQWFSAVRVARHTLLQTGLIFLALQIGGTVFFGFDSLILSSTKGAVAASEYAVLQRLFMFITIPLMTFNAPYWGAYAEATARGDTVFVRRTLWQNFTLTLLLAIIGAVVMMLAGNWIINVWTQAAVQTSALVLFLFGMLAIADASGNALAMFLNGSGIMKPQLGSVIILCAIALPAKFMLVGTYGVVGIVGASLVSYVLSVHIYYGVFLRRHLFTDVLATGKSSS